VVKLFARAVAAVAEAASPPEPTIIEFEPDSGLAVRAAETAAGLESLPAFREVTERMRGVSPRAAAPRRLARGLVRRATVEEVRRSFTRRSLAAREALEKEAARIGGGGEALGPAAVERFVEVCWLNQTLRAASASAALAEVAASKEIRSLDVPRLIRAEVHGTARVVGAPAFREQHGVSGEGIVIAVIDSEVDDDHPAFGGRVAHKGNLTKEAFGVPGDHGTAVAGIAGSADPHHPGIAPGATIFNYKVLATKWWLNADDFGGALAIQQALEDGADVANCSWGAGPAGTGTSREARACDNAWALGLTLVKSAGNRGPGKATLTTPADASGIIVVGATNRAGDRVERYSSRGPTGDGRVRPHLVAPGGDENSSGIVTARPGGGFADAGWGTSYAAPHVAGLVALLLDADPNLTPDQLRSGLIAGSKPFGQNPDANEQGAGLVVL
jgi:serine protease AprX